MSNHYAVTLTCMAAVHVSLLLVMFVRVYTCKPFALVCEMIVPLVKFGDFCSGSPSQRVETSTQSEMEKRKRHVNQDGSLGTECCYR